MSLLAPSGSGSPATPFRYHVEPTQAQLKITHTALRSLRDDFDREDSDVRAVIDEVLGKLPDESAMRAVRLDDALDEELRDRSSAEESGPDSDGSPPPAAA